MRQVIRFAVGDELAAVAERDERGRPGDEETPEAVAHPKRGAARKRRPPIRLNHFFAHGGDGLPAAAFVGAEPSRAFAAATSLLAS